ncbi:MAG: hypothetical protein V2A61_04115 [Calditrichota bacterium]
MNPEKKCDDEDTMRPEYDFDMSKAIRGKYAKRIKEEGSNVILLDADVYEVFTDSKSVNETLRQVIAISELTRKQKTAVKRLKTSKITAKNTSPASTQS